MKKIGLICAALLAGISLTACSNTASQKNLQLVAVHRVKL